ncbi:hypothetical protein HYQ46_012891 [Verticillium longisporum]|nr:hypothetical protein HYQ46_012891 [Verticillium longisporum]
MGIGAYAAVRRQDALDQRRDAGALEDIELGCIFFEDLGEGELLGGAFAVVGRVQDDKAVKWGDVDDKAGTAGLGKALAAVVSSRMPLSNACLPRAASGFVWGEGLATSSGQRHPSMGPP